MFVGTISKNMSKKLAFWGNCNEYGYKIIRILEELGGVNVSNYNASEVTSIYYIDEKNHIKGVYNGNLDREKYVIITYHDFISKYPHQIGDTVYATNNHEKGNVLEIAWDEKREEMKYYVDFENSISWMHTDEIFSYIQFNDEEKCGTLLKSSKMKNVLVELLEHIKTTSKEDLEREFEELNEWTNVGPTVEEFRAFCECVNRKPKYPTTYEECCQHLGCDDKLSVGKLIPFQQLINVRNAYWKIAGEEMDLGKPWEPNWTTFEDMPAIFRFRYNIVCDSIKNQYCLLVFPTEEIRDAFYENFKDLIEQCKELL